MFCCRLAIEYVVKDRTESGTGGKVFFFGALSRASLAGLEKVKSCFGEFKYTGSIL